MDKQPTTRTVCDLVVHVVDTSDQGVALWVVGRGPVTVPWDTLSFGMRSPEPEVAARWTAIFEEAQHRNLSAALKR
jgi:hypothetical protein